MSSASISLASMIHACIDDTTCLCLFKDQPRIGLIRLLQGVYDVVPDFDRRSCCSRGRLLAVCDFFGGVDFDHGLEKRKVPR
jgi:hypothetical protein